MGAHYRNLLNIPRGHLLNVNYCVAYRDKHNISNLVVSVHLKAITVHQRIIPGRKTELRANLHGLNATSQTMGNLHCGVGSLWDTVAVNRRYNVRF